MYLHKNQGELFWEQYLRTTNSPNIDGFLGFWEAERRKDIQKDWESEDRVQNVKERVIWGKQQAAYREKERREKIRELKKRGLFRTSRFESNI